jgi:hypothetical protein
MFILKNSIRTKIVGPYINKGKVIKAYIETVSIEYDESVSYEINHWRASRVLSNRIGLTGELTGILCSDGHMIWSVNSE